MKTWCRLHLRKLERMFCDAFLPDQFFGFVFRQQFNISTFSKRSSWLPTLKILNLLTQCYTFSYLLLLRIYSSWVLITLGPNAFLLIKKKITEFAIIDFKSGSSVSARKWFAEGLRVQASAFYNSLWRFIDLHRRPVKSFLVHYLSSFSNDDLNTHYSKQFLKLGACC